MPTLTIRPFLLATLISLFLCLNAYAQHAVPSIPNPKAAGNDHYVSDPDGNLGASTRAQLDAISTAIEQANGSEFAIVVVDDYQGDSDFDFAMDLFAQWGIGKQGSDNGLLLFLGMDRREYRFITGYGLESMFPDALLNQIAELYLVPYLKAGDTDMAVLSTAKAVESVFLSPTHALELAGLQAYRPTFWNRVAVPLEQSLAVVVIYGVGFAWMTLARRRVLQRYAIKTTRRYKGMPVWYAFFTCLLLMFIGLFVFVFLEIADQFFRFRNLPYFVATFGVLLLLYQFYGSVRYLKESTKDAKTSLDLRATFTRWTLVPLLLSPLAYFAYVELGRYRKASRLRATPPTLPGAWERLHRDRLKTSVLQRDLSDVQRREEKIGARSYEIWRDQASGSTHLVAFDGEKSKRYETCPSCHGRTLKQPEVKVRKAATRKSTGTGERMQSCAFCDYSISLGMVTLPVLQDSSSSGSSGGGGGGGGSSGGSFGGGSSGGGGAGGRW